jgi:hypothetical protein
MVRHLGAEQRRALELLAPLHLRPLLQAAEQNILHKI